ncbi:winged helix-turn-helix domain-containing protein [Methyloglobulus sp.]|uniref:winged helix-turn-helix domain-containing protein n=1 Tax=Methyloglobulus sp. TaxID=2518622 RepID=UPI0032B7BB72
MFNRRQHLQPKVYHLLLYFLENPGRLISREELFKEVWQGRIVEDTALRLAVNILRKALRDNSKSPLYILTACKCGYRFLPEVSVEVAMQKNTATFQTIGFNSQPKAEFEFIEIRQDYDLDWDCC